METAVLMKLKSEILMDELHKARLREIDASRAMIPPVITEKMEEVILYNSVTGEITGTFQVNLPEIISDEIVHDKEPIREIGEDLFEVDIPGHDTIIVDTSTNSILTDLPFVPANPGPYVYKSNGPLLLPTPEELSPPHWMINPNGDAVFNSIEWRNGNSCREAPTMLPEVFSPFMNAVKEQMRAIPETKKEPEESEAERRWRATRNLCR